jgi:hypothetical protein
MLKNLDDPIVDLSGDPVTEPDGSKPSIKSVAVTALLNSPEGTPTATQKADRYHLAMRLHKGGDQDLTVEELALIKSLVGAFFLPLVVGQVFDWCDK